MESVYKAILSIAHTPLPSNGQVNVSEFRDAIQAARKTNNPLVIKRLDDLQKQAMANVSIRPLLIAVGTGQSIVTLTPALQKEIGDFIEQQTKGSLDTLVKQRQMTIKETNLRRELLALKVEVERGNKQAVNKENDAARKKRLEQEAKKVDVVIRAFQDLQAVDPLGVAEIQRETGINAEQLQQIVRPNLGTTEARNSIVAALSRLQGGNVTDFVDEEFTLGVDDVTQNILSFTNTFVQSDIVQNGIENVRTLTRGKVNPNVETIARMVFQLVRGAIANFLATSSIVARFGPEVEGRARELGRGLHWRLALEAYWSTPDGRKQAAARGRTVNGRPSFTEVSTMSTDQLQALILPGTNAQEIASVKQRWDTLYTDWSRYAQRCKVNSQQIRVPMPTAKDAFTETAVQEYQAKLAKVQAVPVPVTAPTEAPRTQIIGTLDFTTAGKVEVTPDATGRSVEVANKRVTFKKEGTVYTMSFPEGNGTRRIELVDAFSTAGQRGNFNKLELSNRGATDAASVKVVLNNGTEPDAMALGTLVTNAINQPGKPKAVFASRTAVTFE